jgi:5-methylcytosine-specific restriction enzyme A
MSTKRFSGKLTAAKLLPKNESGFTACRWCNGDVMPPKRTICSEECRHEITIRTHSGYMKRCVYQRDKGICSICNVDTKHIAKTALSLEKDDRIIYLAEHNIGSKRKVHKRKLGGGLWDADHIVCVKDGGGECGLDNLRTLCIKCHKLITKTSYQK